RRAISPEGRSFSRQLSLGQVRRRPPQDLVLLLQQPNPTSSLTQLPCVLRGDAGLHAVLDIGGTQPLRDRHLMDPEVLGDLCQRHTGTTVPGDPHDVLTKLTGIGPGHSNILPACSASKRSEMSQIRAAAPGVPRSAPVASRGDTRGTSPTEGPSPRRPARSI